ncbi:MAG: hypothetical protein VKJ02_06800 [Snowella sp.]|nr:hypothetical protein [Snowella sp.]
MTTNKPNNTAHEEGLPDLSSFLEAIASSLEDFMADVQQTVEEVAESIHQEIGQELEDFWRELIAPFINLEMEEEIHFNFEEDFNGESDLWLNPKVEPTGMIHPACVGCANYHGRVYNNSLLVCGMHPYGVEADHCPDWEEKSKP